MWDLVPIHDKNRHTNILASGKTKGHVFPRIRIRDTLIMRNTVLVKKLSFLINRKCKVNYLQSPWLCRGYHSLTLICEQVVSSSLFGTYSPCEALESPLQAALGTRISNTFPDPVLLVPGPGPMSRRCIRFVQCSGSMMFRYVSILLDYKSGSCTFL
jgi:hypothetical protein